MESTFTAKQSRSAARRFDDEGLYQIARDHAEQGYVALAETLRSLDIRETGDKVAFNDSGLDVPALDTLLRELAGLEEEESS